MVAAAAAAGDTEDLRRAFVGLVADTAGEQLRVASTSSIVVAAAGALAERSRVVAGAGVLRTSQDLESSADTFASVVLAWLHRSWVVDNTVGRPFHQASADLGPSGAEQRGFRKKDRRERLKEKRANVKEMHSAQLILTYLGTCQPSL